MRKLILTILLSFSFAFIVKANIITDTISLSTNISVCENDTLTISINNTGSSSSVHNVSITLPFGYNLVGHNSSLANPSTSINNTYSFDILNLSSGINSLEVYTEVGCQTNTSGKYYVEIFDGQQNSVYIDSSSVISIFRPNLIITGLENTNSTNSTTYTNGNPINLSQLKTGDTYIRKFKVLMTSSSAEVSEFTIKVPKISYDILGVSNSPTITYSGNLDTAYYHFNLPIIGSDSIVFCDTIQIETGCIQGTSIAADIEVFWGCGGSFCDSSSVIAEGNMIAPSPSPSINYVTSGHIAASNGLETSGYSICEQNFVEFEVVNNSTGTPIAGAMFDVRLQFGARGNSSFNNANLLYDSILINGQSVPFSNGSTGGRKYIDTLIASNYSGGGLTNINNDNYLNDIQPGTSLTVRYYFKILDINTPNGDSCYNNTGKTFWTERMWLEASYKNICDEESVLSGFHNAGGGFGMQLNMSGNNMLYLQGAHDSLFTITLSETWRDRGMNDNRIAYSHCFIVPNYVNVDTYTSTVSGHSLNISNGTTHDTIKVSGNDIDFNESTTMNFYISCAEKIDRCSSAPFEVFGKTYIELVDGNGNMCHSICAQEKSVFVQDISCDSIYSEMQILDTLVERATFGWTDNTLSTRASRSTPGIVLDTAHNFDSLRLYIKALSHDNITLDSLYYIVKYIHPYTTAALTPSNGFDPISLLNSYGKIRLYDQGTGTDQTYIINNLAPYIYNLFQDTIVTGETSYTFNFSSFIDSMRAEGAGANFIIGGDIGSASYSIDSLEIEIYFYGNQQSLSFEITPQVQISSTSIPDVAIVPNKCNVPSTLNTIYIKHYVIGFAPFYRQQYLCKGFEVRLGNPSNSWQPNINLYHPEIRQIGFFDTMSVNWNSSFVGLADSTLYYVQGHGNSGSDYKVFFPFGDDSIADINDYMIHNDSLLITPPDSLWQIMGQYGYGINLQQTCNATTNSDVSIQFNASGYNYYQGIGGPQPYIYSNSFTPGGGVDNTNVQALSPVTFQPVLSADTACWITELSNNYQLRPEGVNNNWLDFSSLNGSINIISVDEVDLSGNFISNLMLNSHPNGKWVKAEDSLLYPEVHRYRTCAVIDLCVTDSLIVKSGYNCVSWPDSSTFDYPPTAYTCPSKIQQVSIFNGTPSAVIEYSLVNQTPMPVNVCDTLQYTMSIKNVGLGAADSIAVRATEPIGLDIVQGVSILEFPTGVFSNITTTNLSSNITEWDLSNVINVNNTLEDILSTNNEALLTFKAVTGCPFISNSQIEFAIDFHKECGVTETQNTLASAPINIIGVPTTPDKVIELTNFSDANHFCEGKEISFDVIHSGGAPTNNNSYIIIEIDSNYTISDSVSGGNLNGVYPTNTYYSGTNQVFEYNLSTGFQNDTMTFSFILSEQNSVSCNDSILISAKFSDKYSLICSSTGEQCDVYLDFDTISGEINIIKPAITINNFSSRYNLCDDSITINYTVNITEANISESNLNLLLVNDVNANNIYDNGDITLSIPADTYGILLDGSVYTYEAKELLSNFSSTPLCNLILLVDSDSSCACNSITNTTVTNLIGGTSWFEAIECESSTLEGCSNNSAFIYRWYSPSNTVFDAYLSSTNSSSTGFTPPNTDNEGTVDYTYIIEAGYSSCIGTDTVIVTVSNSTTPCEFGVTIYNFLSPNGNNLNDVFIIDGIQFFPQNHLTIYNRWGAVVYEKEQYDNTWDGTHKGKPLPSGTYFYVLKLNKEEPIHKGYIELTK